MRQEKTIDTRIAPRLRYESSDESEHAGVVAYGLTQGSTRT